ncbi:hypothetical protein EDB19DRAFT_2024660 [Suillus lakei]|nr:hypothetical protein EDB19DRAFT_2024660 [Suillus lakei]
MTTSTFWQIPLPRTTIPSTGVVCDQGWALMLLAKGEPPAFLYWTWLSEVGNSKPSRINHQGIYAWWYFLDISMAVTSAASAELIGISSLFIYQTYFRPNATGDVIAQTQQLNAGDIDLGWERLSRRESRFGAGGTGMG